LSKDAKLPLKKSVLDCAAQQFCKVPVSGYTSPFFKEHREFNVRRIGFVASEITKNGGIALCAPIALYPEARVHNRNLISQTGGFVEAFMNTPLEVCEQRDRKGLYAKARAGLVKGVTGIDDPYIPPANPEVTIDTTEKIPVEAAQIIFRCRLT